LDNDIGGLAVHIAARILGHAGAGEILVSRTVRDLVIGSGTGFEDRGPVALRGVAGTWPLLAVDRHGARAGVAAAERGSHRPPRPSDRDASLGPCCRVDRQADTMDRARDGPPSPGHWSQMSSRSHRAWRCLSPRHR